MSILCKWFGHKYTKKRSVPFASDYDYSGGIRIERTCGRCGIEYIRICSQHHSDESGVRTGIKHRFKMKGKTISETDLKEIENKAVADEVYADYFEDYKSEDVDFKYVDWEIQERQPQ